MFDYLFEWIPSDAVFVLILQTDRNYMYLLFLINAIISDVIDFAIFLKINLKRNAPIIIECIIFIKLHVCIFGIPGRNCGWCNFCDAIQSFIPSPLLNSSIHPVGEVNVLPLSFVIQPSGSRESSKERLRSISGYKPPSPAWLISSKISRIDLEQQENVFPALK